MLPGAGYADSPKGSLQTAVLPGIELDETLEVHVTQEKPSGSRHLSPLPCI